MSSALAREIARVLPQLRAEAEGRMLDTCRITAPGTSAGAWDEATGTYGPAVPVIVYTGRCRLRNPFSAPQSADAGEAQWGVDQAVLSLPLSDPTSADVQDGHEVEMLASVNDPGMAGLRLTVQAQHFQTDSTARRLPCQVVTRDA